MVLQVQTILDLEREQQTEIIIKHRPKGFEIHLIDIEPGNCFNSYRLALQVITKPLTENSSGLLTRYIMTRGGFPTSGKPSFSTLILSNMQ